MSSETNPKPRGWKHFFMRRNKAATEGRHLPATADLMLGMSFFGNDLNRDAQLWAERLLMRLDEAKEGPLCAPVVQALQRHRQSRHCRLQSCREGSIRARGAE